MLNKFFKNIGRGPLIAAAFIGPGTVTICTLAGVKFGIDLLWTLLIAILATIVLQSMAAKAGLISRKNLTQIIIDELKNPIIKYGIITLILLSIVIGNTAYESGNISGAVLGLETLFGSFNFKIDDNIFNLYPIIIGLVSGFILWSGKFKIIERFLIVLVIIMSLSFVLTTVFTNPDLLTIFKGLFYFKTPNESLLTIMALIGTTIVPYNLFLHAELVKKKWSKKSELSFAYKDLIIAISFGGFISLCIIITASNIDSIEINNARDLAIGLEPLFGIFAKYLIAIGLFAAGITSTITAPLAAAFVICGCFGLSSNLKSLHFKFTWILIIFFGVIISTTGLKLISIIRFAQITNGILLPIIASLLLWIVNKTDLMGDYKNSLFKNLIAFFIVLLSFLLSIKTILLIIQ